MSIWVAAAVAAASIYAQQREQQMQDPPLFAALKQSKCESCGSREWVAHDGKEVCAYCRGDR